MNLTKNFAVILLIAHPSYHPLDCWMSLVEFFTVVSRVQKNSLEIFFGPFSSQKTIINFDNRWSDLVVYSCFYETWMNVLCRQLEKSHLCLTELQMIKNWVNPVLNWVKIDSVSFERCCIVDQVVNHHSQTLELALWFFWHHFNVIIKVLDFVQILEW